MDGRSGFVWTPNASSRDSFSKCGEQSVGISGFVKDHFAQTGVRLNVDTLTHPSSNCNKSSDSEGQWWPYSQGSIGSQSFNNMELSSAPICAQHTISTAMGNALSATGISSCTRPFLVCHAIQQMQYPMLCM